MTSPRSRAAARGRAALCLAAAALLALTACSPDEPAPEAPPSSASATQQLPPMDMAPFTLDAPSLDLELVPGASLAVIEGTDPEYHAAWLQVPGAPAWSEGMSRHVRDHVSQYSRDTDTSADPVLDVQPRLAVAGEDIGAVRLLSTERRGNESVSAARVIWYSPVQDRVLPTADLFTEAGWDDFRAEVGERMQNDPAVVRERLESAVRNPDQVENGRVWDALILLADGSVLLEVDQAALAPADAGVLTARIPADVVRPWLSDLGRAAQDAARDPQTMRLPERASASPSSTSESAAPAPAPDTRSPSSSAPGSSSGDAGTSPGGTTSTSPSSSAVEGGGSSGSGADGSSADGTSGSPSAPGRSTPPPTTARPSTSAPTPGTSTPGSPTPGTSAPGSSTQGTAQPTTSASAPTRPSSPSPTPSRPTTTAPSSPRPTPTPPSEPSEEPGSSDPSIPASSSPSASDESGATVRSMPEEEPTAAPSTASEDAARGGGSSPAISSPGEPEVAEASATGAGA